MSCLCESKSIDPLYSLEGSVCLYCLARISKEGVCLVLSAIEVYFWLFSTLDLIPFKNSINSGLFSAWLLSYTISEAGYGRVSILVLKLSLPTEHWLTDFSRFRGGMWILRVGPFLGLLLMLDT